MVPLWLNVEVQFTELNVFIGLSVPGYKAYFTTVLVVRRYRLLLFLLVHIAEDATTFILAGSTTY
jgi:hypothetical protein